MNNSESFKGYSTHTHSHADAPVTEAHYHPCWDYVWLLDSSTEDPVRRGTDIVSYCSWSKKQYCTSARQYQAIPQKLIPIIVTKQSHIEMRNYDVELWWIQLFSFISMQATCVVLHCSYSIAKDTRSTLWTNRFQNYWKLFIFDQQHWVSLTACQSQMRHKHKWLPCMRCCTCSILAHLFVSVFVWVCSAVCVRSFV